MKGAIIIMLTFAFAAVTDASDAGKGNPVIVITTTKGVIEVELFKDKAPLSVENFIQYLKSKHYDGTVFHRVIPGFMIQGGGFDANLKQKATREPVKNEAANGLKNERGTLAMARTSVVDSATSQFFINLKNNSFLDHGTRDFGYAVFGKVNKGMDVVDAIAAVRTGAKGAFNQDCPIENVVIESMKVK
jgi:Peptidyl-prolyl cis-trans isomerase (rotamase) - cyclophilin family